MRLAIACALALALGLPARLGAQSPVAAILANGYRFAYREQGHGPPVVFVHGPLADFRFWTGAMIGLPDSVHAIAYSRRYAWPNPWRPDDPPYGAAADASDLLALIRALHLERPLLVGHDAGATISLLAALREPRAIRGVVLVEPPLDRLADQPSPGPEDPEAWATARAAGAPERPIPSVRVLVEQREGRGAWDRTPPDERQGMEENAQSVFLTDPSEPVLACAALEKLSVPVTLIQGAATPARFQRILDGMARCLPRAGRDTVPEAGHAAPLTHPPQFATRLAALLQRPPR